MAAPGYKIYCEQSDYAGEAEFIRLLFEEVEVRYEEVSDEDTLKSLFEKGELVGWPCMAPPMVERVGGAHVSHTPVICKFLGKLFGVAPPTAVEEAKCDQIVQDAYKLCAAVHLADAQEDEAGGRAAVDAYARHFERALTANRGGNGLYVVGLKPSYGDLALLHAVRISNERFPDLWTALESEVPKLAAFKKRMETRPGLAKYFKSGRSKSSFPAKEAEEVAEPEAAAAEPEA